MKIKRVLIIMIFLITTIMTIGGCAGGNGNGGGTPPNPYALDPDSFDQYGGLKSITGTITGYFHVEKIGARWWFITPEGNGFWSVGANLVTDAPNDGTDNLGNTYNDNIVAKYGDKPTWGIETAKKMVAWGFNTAGGGTSTYLDPDGKYGRAATIPKIAKIHKHRLGYYSIRDAGVANILDGVYGGGTFPDVFDPAFETHSDLLMSQSSVTGGLAAENASGSFTLGWYTDEELRGFGAWDRHVHLGYAATATSATTYTKQAWRDLLQSRYLTITALNAAYGTSYTEWGSNGSTGVLDETGLGDYLTGSANITIKADQDTFLYMIARKYFEVTTAAFRKYRPNFMILGPMFSTWYTAPRDEVMRAAKDLIDVFGVGGAADHNYIYEYTGKPVLVYTTWVTAEPDSPLNTPCASVPQGYDKCRDTQEERGVLYKERLIEWKDKVSSGGENFVVGIQWWKWSDNGPDYWLEQQNFGFVSIKDNAYDGVEARVQTGTDSSGYAVGGEAADYGNFIGAVIDANEQVMYELANE